MVRLIFTLGTRYVICVRRVQTQARQFLVSSLRSLGFTFTVHRSVSSINTTQYNRRPQRASISYFCERCKGSWQQQPRNRTSNMRTSHPLPLKADTNNAVRVPSPRQNAQYSKNSSKKSITHHGISPSPVYFNDGSLTIDIPTMILNTGLSRESMGKLMCRHVMLPKDALKHIPKDYFDTETGTLRLLHEEEWRSLGITQVRPLLIPQG